MAEQTPAGRRDTFADEHARFHGSRRPMTAKACGVPDCEFVRQHPTQEGTPVTEGLSHRDGDQPLPTPVLIPISLARAEAAVDYQVEHHPWVNPHVKELVASIVKAGLRGLLDDPAGEDTGAVTRAILRWQDAEHDGNRTRTPELDELLDWLMADVDRQHRQVRLLQLVAKQRDRLLRELEGIANATIDMRQPQAVHLSDIARRALPLTSKVKGGMSAEIGAAIVTNVDENTSDGHHTFKELYEYRRLYNAGLFNEWAARGVYDVHKARRHSDGEPCFGGGWFIVVAQLPTGQISNHYPDEAWPLFRIPEWKRGAVWDGHTPAVAAERLRAFIAAGDLS